MSQTLTDLKIRKLMPEANGRVEIWDGRVPAFGIRVAPTGSKSFVLLYRHKGRPRRMTIGRYPVVSLAEARRRAIQALGEVAWGVDPQTQKTFKTHGTRFDETVDMFVRTYCSQHNRKSTQRETERLLKARFVSRWGARDLREIGKADVLKIIDATLQDGAPSAANHALATVRLFFNWCCDRGLVEINPCDRLKAPAKKVARDRVLSDGELAKIWAAACTIGYPFGTIAQLLLLTAQRRNEVTSMRWTDLDFEAALWSIPATLTKNGAPHVVPLVPEVLHILKRVPRIDSDMLFPSRAGEGRSFSGFSKAKERLAALSAVDEFTLHDLRRTVATRLASLGAAPHVIERLLNHVTGILGGVAGVYNRFKYHDEVRAALVQWTSHMRQLAGPGFCGGDATQTVSLPDTGAPVLLAEEVQLADSVASATHFARELCTR
jgi:integrase